MTWLAGTWSQFTLGYEKRRDELESTSTGDHSADINAWYIQDEIAAGESLIIVIGQRYDDHSVYGDQWSPRASARYLFSGSGTILRLSYGESFRGPTFNDLYWPNVGWAMGNPDLVPETAKEYEAGLEQQLGTGNVLKVTGFERKVKDLIDWKEFAPFQYRPENIGRATIKGAEAEALLRFAATSSFAVNYTYLNPVDETTGEKIYYTIPKEQIKGTLIFAVDQDVYITAEGRSVKNYVKAGEPKWQYSVYDAKIAQKIGRKGAARGEIYFAMLNIFDRKYENARGYPMPPKEIRGGLTVPF
jgi:outer membrane cobalamin receptor